MYSFVRDSVVRNPRSNTDTKTSEDERRLAKAREDMRRRATTRRHANVSEDKRR